MFKILITGSIHETGLEILHKEKDIEIQYAPDLALAEVFKIIAPLHSYSLGNANFQSVD